MSNFLDESRHAAGFHVLILCINVFNKPHKGLRRGVLVVRRGSEPAKNAAHREKGHLEIENRLPAKGEIIMHRIGCNPARAHGQYNGGRAGHDVTAGPHPFFGGFAGLLIHLDVAPLI
jgi:hypothetical protein